MSSSVERESKSTEYVLSQLDVACIVVEEKGRYVCVGSGDTTALYPSLKHAPSAKLCGQLVLESKGDFKGIDFRAAGVMLAAACTVKEIKAAGLTSVVPRRKYKMGKRPTLATKELNTRESKKTGTEEEETDDLNDDRG